MSRTRLISVGVLCAAVSGLAGGGAFAQAVRPPNAAPTPQELNPGEQLQGAPKPKRSSDIFSPPDPGPCTLRGSDVPFTLKSVTFTGLTGLKVKTLEPAYRKEIGKPAKVEEICDIRDRVASVLFDHGIFARVEIPAQTISNGVLELQVIEARVVNIRFHGDAGPAQAKVEDYIERLRGMKPFDLIKAERYLLLANEVPGVQVSAGIRPSDEGPGAVDLDITTSRTPRFDAAISTHNLGSKPLGPWSGLLRGDVNSITPFGDRTSLVLYSTLDGKEQKVAQLLSEFRPTGTGLKINGSVSYATTAPGDVLAQLHLQGKALNAVINASYPLLHTRAKSLYVGGGLELADQRTDFADGGTLIDDKLRIAFARAAGEVRNEVFGEPYSASLELQVRKGLSGMGASKAGSPTLSRASGIPTATLERAEGSFEWLPFSWLDVNVEGLAQFTSVPLLSYEQMSLGNLSIVRGYDPASVAGDRGYALKFEPSVAPFKPIFGQKISFFAFYDIAQTEFVDIREKLNVSSTGAGVRLRPAAEDQHGFGVDLFYADPLDKISPAAARKPPGRVLFSITYRH